MPKIAAALKAIVGNGHDPGVGLNPGVGAVRHV